MIRNRILSTVLLMALAPVAARAHFVFVVPDNNGSTAKAFISEDLEPDEDVPADLVAGARLSLKDPSGQETPLTLTKGTHAYSLAIPGHGPRVVHGIAPLGVEARGTKPFRLVYHPKTILGDAFDSSANLGKEASYEIVPVGKVGAVQFQILAGGKPAGGDEVTVVLPDGKQQKAKTDNEGKTAVFTQTGRYGVWGRHVEAGAGEVDGKHYDETRHYPTLVADIGTAAAVAKAPVVADDTPKAETFGNKLPEAVASFGAVASDGWLYVYGGHTARTHSYSTDAISGHFHRLKLGVADAKWEALPDGPKLQGMNLAAYEGKVYRVGGMEPQNKPGTKADNYSTADVARFDPAVGKWEALPPLPETRSSHDVAVVDGKLYVIGGWSMHGAEGGNTWLKTMAVLDLKAERPEWKSVPQALERRALIVAVLDSKIYVIGGFNEDDEPSRKVDIYDTATGTWSSGPELPGKDMNGFAPAACTLEGRIYASVGDGSFLRLRADGSAWEKIAKSTPRIVHRLAPSGSQVLIFGGADKGSNFDLIEAVDVGSAKATAAGTDAKATDVVSASSATQTLCPVMTGSEIDPVDAKVVEYKGAKVLLCCDTCLKKWKADPEAYARAETLPQLAAGQVPARALKQVYCPVYKDRIVSDKDPFVMYKGQKVYLFNKSAVKKWEANPAKYVDTTILPQLAGLAEK